MAVPEENPFARNDVFPSWFANAIQRFLTTAAPAFQLTRQDATHIQVTAGSETSAAVIAIAAKWRWIEATINRAHPGGAAGTWDIFVVAAANKIEAGGIDATNRAFSLRILKSGETPTIEAGVVDIFRKVGSLQWSGTEITRVDQTVPATATHAHRHATGEPDAIAPADIGAAPESEAEALRAMGADQFQPGVVTANDWSMTASIVGGTGVLGSAGNTGGTAWIKVASALLRTSTVSATLSGIAPPSLPVSGKFMSIGLQLTPGVFGGAATVSAVSGVEKATEAEALAAPANEVAGKLRIRDVIVKNTAGVFSIAAQRDRRPWARGYDFTTTAVNSLEVTAETTLAELTQRVEHGEGSSAAPAVSLLFTAQITQEAAAALGIVVKVFANGNLNSTNEVGAEVKARHTAVVYEQFTPGPGSQLYQVKVVQATAGKPVFISQARLRIYEALGNAASNGTS